MDEINWFRRALKSPVRVGGLCLLAIVAGYLNLTGSPVKKNLSLPTLLSRNPASSVTKNVHPPRYDKAGIEWMDHPLRDPFSPFRRTDPADSPSPPQPGSSGRVTPHSGQLVLKAVAVEEKVKSAVINRMIVREGDRVEGFLVLSIGPRGVWLEQNGRRQWLTFPDKTLSS